MLQRSLILIAVFIVSMNTALISHAQPSASANIKGYIVNDYGKKCWYKQKRDPENRHFLEIVTQTVGIMTFDDPMCMKDSGVGLNANKGMINNIVRRWYSHKDAKFQTRVSEMYPTSELQKKGKCIQSKTYPMQGIVIDYFVKNNSITGVIHGGSIMGCKKK